MIGSPKPTSYESLMPSLVNPLSSTHPIPSTRPSPNVPDYRKNYWGSAFPALLAVKQKYDPQNFFRFAQMISAYPDGSTGAAPGQELWPPAIAEALRQPIDRGVVRNAGR